MSPGTRRYARALSWVATITSAVVLVVSGGAYAYVSYLDSKITRFGDLCVRHCTNPAEVGSAENFLLVGVDSREGDNGTGVNAGLKSASTGGSRSDTTLLVHISSGGARVDVVSFPRDMLVTVPAYTTRRGTVLPAHRAKFNAAFAEGADDDPKGGGPRLLTEQIRADFHLAVDHYVQIDFAGFEKMVRALGTVQVCLSQDAYDPGNPAEGTLGTGLRLKKGIHNLGPELALQFVRQRDGLPNSDLDRINRQQRFLAAILRKAESAGTLTNPAKLNRFLTAALGAVTVDNGTHLEDLETLGRHLRGLGSGGVHFFTVPTGPHVLDPGLGDYLPVDTAKAQPLLQAIHDDEDPTQASQPKPAKATPAVAAAALSTVHVTSVDNGSGVTGAAKTAADTLRAKGVTVDGTGNATRVATTTVSYGSGAQAQAQALVALLPGARTTPDAHLGAGLVRVVLGAAPTAPSGAAATPSAARPTSATNFKANGTLCGP